MTPPPLSATERSRRALDQALDTGPDLLAGHLTEVWGSLPPGTRLGPWTVRELLDTGGMGRVYLAERADGAFEKQVAIKVLRRERRLPDAVIERERALLARLEHPGLTRLLDGGASADGDVYLVMEWVDGDLLDAWCTAHQADRNTRLKLFDQLLDTVGHAHRQLVVHGDLKPANLLVDRQNRLRVLDFGVARLLADDRAVALPAVTPHWAAPECLAGAPPDVASDIYNLGLLLAHLAQPQGEARPKRLPPDLAAIIAKATATDPEARYASVAGLREDLARYRHLRPVKARAGGNAYRLQRFVRRHWIGAGFASILLGILVAAGSLFVWQDRIVRAERDSARMAAARSQTVLDYLLGVLGQADQTGSDAKPASLRKLLTDSLAHLDSDFSGDPAARQALLARLGDLLVRLNDFASAQEVLERFQRSAGTDTPPQLRARVLDNLAVIRLHAGKLDEALALTLEGERVLRKVPADQRGQQSELLVTKAQILSKQGRMRESVATLRQALSLRLAVSAPDAAQTVVVRNSLAASLMRSGQLDEALRQYRQLETALESSRRQHSLDAATIYANHASTAFAYGRYHEAERLFEQALSLQQKLYGPSASFAALLNNSGKLDLALGHVDKARAQIHRAVDMMQRFAGPDSVDAQLIRISLAQLALAEDRFDDARTVYSDIGDRLAATLGGQHPLVTRVRSGQLTAHARATGLGASDPAFDRMLDQLGANPINQRPHADLLCERARMALRQKQGQLAGDYAGKCLELRRKLLATDSPPLLVAAFLQASAQAQLLADDGARQRRNDALEVLRTHLGPDHPDFLRLSQL